MFESPVLGQTLTLQLLLLVMFQFWFMFEGRALGQARGFYLVMEFCFNFGLCLRVQQSARPIVCTWCWSHGVVLVYVQGSSSRLDPWFPLGDGIMFQFWSMFEGLAVGQTHGLHLVLES
jgi:hypothetical protein